MKPSLTFRALVAALAVFALAGAAACGRPFKIETAPGMVELDDPQPGHDFRAMTPEGVVVGVRTVDTAGRGNLEFWTRTIGLRMRQMNGYALLGEADVQSRDGTPGKELRFGHDDNGKRTPTASASSSRSRGSSSSSGVARPSRSSATAPRSTGCRRRSR